MNTDIVTVGVTGTNGKTTTTSWIAAALRRLGGPVARATTVGFFVDDEELALERSYDGFLEGMLVLRERGGKVAAVELTSEALARGFAKWWPARVGVFTNLTHDHLDAHGSPEHYLASKAQLFVLLQQGGTAVLNASDPVFDLLREVIPPHVHVVSYATPSRGMPRAKPDLEAHAVDVSWRGTRVHCGTRDLHVRAIGEIFAENAMAALLGAVAAGVPEDTAAEAIANAPSPPGRFEVIHERPYVVVDYAHSPDALARTVRTARVLANRLFVVFGAGGSRDKEKRAPMGEAARPADVVILTTDNSRDEDPRAIADAIAGGLLSHGDVRVVLDRKQAIALAITEAGPDDVVLVAGRGHEVVQLVGGKSQSFSDVDVARAIVRAR